jgi:hypothetical protein
MVRQVDEVQFFTCQSCKALYRERLKPDRKHPTGRILVDGKNLKTN